MPLIECIDLSKNWAASTLFAKIAFAVEGGEKVGLVGRNGCGKTSLLGILAGLDEDFRGRLLRRGGLRCALVPQRYEPPIGLRCVDVLMEPIHGLKKKLSDLEESFSTEGGEVAESDTTRRRGLELYGELATRFEAAGGELAEDGARRLLSRIGLGDAAEAPARGLSGGEKNVLALALALMGDPELLLLDEPGNHLDFGGLAWLEDFIRSERRAILMVSHNRHLLDACVDRIVELDEGRVTEYAGGWSAYRLEKLARAAGQGRDWQADRKRIERLEALVRRFAEIARARPDPAWGKRLRARRSQLERERQAATAKPELGGGGMSVNFGAAASKADFALIVRGYRKAYGDRVLLDGAELDLLVGERAALVGPNGCGKTSFLRDLVASEGKWEEGGPIRVGPSMRVGYCAQEQELFRGERSVAQEFEDLGARADEAYRLLKRYRFDRSILEARIDSLSGGELNRLQIARAVHLGANFLVLDEPTNHLDIEGREALEDGLADFAGTVLAVSHDRWFLEKIAHRIVVMEEGRLVAYEGSFAEYWRDLGAARARSSRGARVGIEGRGVATEKTKKVAATAIAKKVAPTENTIKVAGKGRALADGRELEERISAQERRKEELERASASATDRRDYAAAGRAAREAAELGRMLDRLYAEWESLG